MADKQEQYKRRWLDYQTASGARPVQEFIKQQSGENRQAILAAMKDVEQEGLTAARHLRGEVYEVRAEGTAQSFRILFATEGRYHQILLSLEAFSKKTQKTPPEKSSLPSSVLRTGERVGKHNARQLPFFVRQRTCYNEMTSI